MQDRYFEVYNSPSYCFLQIDKLFFPDLSTVRCVRWSFFFSFCQWLLAYLQSATTSFLLHKLVYDIFLMKTYTTLLQCSYHGWWRRDPLLNKAKNHHPHLNHRNNKKPLLHSKLHPWTPKSHRAVSPKYNSNRRLPSQLTNRKTSRRLHRGKTWSIGASSNHAWRNPQDTYGGPYRENR